MYIFHLITNAISGGDCSMNLTQKETMLLQDHKKSEELCIKKYNSYANQVQDQALKQMFLSYAQQEQQHLNTINQILNGQMPNTNQQGQQQQQSTSSTSTQSGSQTNIQGTFSSNDADLCQDLLSTEKYISATYNSAIFEFRDHNIRQALNHIQKEEQQHGEDIFLYMQNHGMYNVQ